MTLAKARLLEFVRNFPENGLKLLLEDYDNLGDVLALDRYPHLGALDLPNLTLDRTTYIQPNFRHLLTDLVYRIPFQPGGRTGAADALTVYLLLEHETEPDELTSLWLLGYLSAIYLNQHRVASLQGLVKPGWQLQPVLPVVLYTGNRSWERPKPLSELIAGAQLFLPQVPDFAPRFVNIDHLTEREIDRRSTGFGQVLWLLRHRHTQTGFDLRLARTVRRLEQLREVRRSRWLDLLSYLHALVYHERPVAQCQELQQVIRDAVQTDPARREVQAMEKSYAQVLEERGQTKEAVQSRQDVLLLQLQERFDKVPAGIVETVRATQEVKRLNTWLKRVVAARRLADVGIPPAP